MMTWPDEETVQQSDAGDHVLLVVHGGLSMASANLTVRRALRKHLLDRGRVVVDLSGATVRWTPAVDVFPSVLAAAGGWPSARLTLAGADSTTERVLRSARVHLTVPVAGDRDQARVLLDVRPERVSRRHEMPCDLMAPWLARSFGELACDDWELDLALGDAMLMVVTELVGNAVEHAGTDSVLSLRLDHRRLTVAVRDHRPAAEGLPRPGVHGERGYGLLMVQGVSRAWGVTRHDDGKTVWAVLDAGD